MGYNVDIILIMNRVKWHYILILTVLCFIVYSNSLKGEFHFDDYHVLNEVNTTFSFSNLRFFTWLTFYVNAIPEKTNIVFYHLTNLVIHLFAGMAVYLLALFLVGYEKPEVPFFISALFLVHPVATEPVNYISARFTQLTAFFGLLTLLFFIVYMNKKKLLFLGLAAMAFFAGAYSKEVGVFYAFAGIFIYSVYFLEWKKTLAGKKNVLVLSGVVCLLLLLFLYLFTGAFDRFSSPMLWKYFLIQNRVFLLKYMKLMFIPVGLSIEHGVMTIAGFRFDLLLLISLVFNTAVIVYAIVIRKKNKIISFSIIWVYLFHVPYFFLTSGETAVEYRMYPMLFGFVLPVGYCIGNYVRSKGRRKAIFCSLVLILGVLTMFRNSQWREELILWEKTLETNPYSRRALNESGKAYYRKGLHDKAMTNFSRAIELEPANYEAYNNRGNVYKEKGMAGLAIADYSTAVEINPEYSEAYNNRGIVFGISGMNEKAVADFTRALELQSANTRIYYNRALTYRNMGSDNKALADFNRVIESGSRDTDAYLNRGVIYGKQGLYDRAILDFNRVIELNPQNSRAYRYRSVAYRKLGKNELALKDEEKAGALSGGN